MILSRKIASIHESATIAISTEAKKLKAQGIKVYDFSIGEPDFPLAEEMFSTGVKALKENFIKYTPASGISELKIAIAKKLHDENNIPCSEKNITVTNGAKQALYNAFLAILNPGDEVIIPRPYWVSYLEQVKLCDGVPIIAETDHFQIKADFIAKKITKKTKVILINSPCNPTGSVIEAEELKKIAELAVKKDLFIISDEIYEKIIYEKKHLSIASLNKEMFSRTITINGFSKTYGITGLRVGYACADENIIKLMNSIQGHTTSNASSIAQKMALAALTIPEKRIQTWVQEFQEKRDLLCKKIKEMNLPLLTPSGAFYVLVKIPIKTIDSISFCRQLLQEQHVACVPGEAFGEEGSFRISYACSKKDIQEGLEKIQLFLKKISKK
ncbi:pyridoxal phosphate-dependent aminotransferase [Candidatus Woesearchaeota archaeon]|nr:pyridoxal phosphate-dependent aminotransferase [Candidatus Woesearchaeota archaeon]